MGLAAIVLLLAPGVRPLHATPAAVQCPWVTSSAPIAQRVDALLARMTLAQKVRQLHGVRGGKYAGEVPGLPALCIPTLTLQDGPGGIGDDLHGGTQLPAPIALAASWNPDLARAYGAVVGAESRGKGIDVNLGPTLNLVRDPRWGRAFETYGEDPYLTGRIGTGYVRGVQGEGVLANIKHLAVYNQETNRNTPADDVIVDRRSLHGLYLPQFAMVIRAADPASAMCSYSTINGSNACADRYLLTEVLRGQFGFRGFVVSDWGGTHATVAPAEAGMNLEMPDDKYYGTDLEQAVRTGKVPIATIDGLLRPVFTQMFRFNLFARPRGGTSDAVVTTPAHVALARHAAEQGTVLLKNAGGVLPLTASSVHSIAVIGTDAGAQALTVGGGSAHVAAAAIVTPYQGIAARAGQAIKVRYATGNTLVGEPPVVPARYLTPASGRGHGLTGSFYRNRDLSGALAVTSNVSGVDFDWKRQPPLRGMPATDWSARFRGTLTPPKTGAYTFALTSDDGSRLSIDGKIVIDDWGDHASLTKTAQVTLLAGHAVSIDVDYYQAGGGASLRLGWRMPNPPQRVQRERIRQAVKLAADSDVAVVFAGDLQTEGSDFANLDLSGNQNELIAAVAAANPRTIVVLNTGSAVTMPWLDAVAGVIEAWYPGQEDGNAIGAVLFGDVNPSGKLPVTFPRQLADVPAATPAQWPGVDGRVVYSEGLQVGYRWYDARHIAPLFAFGYGLSYSTFEFSRMEVAPKSANPVEGFRASVDVTNTGSRRGADVVQLYVGDPTGTGEPPRQLKGFTRVELDPGETRRVELDVPLRALATWDTQTQGWHVAAGDYRILIGDASNRLPMTGSVRIDHELRVAYMACRSAEPASAAACATAAHPAARPAR